MYLLHAVTSAGLKDYFMMGPSPDGWRDGQTLMGEDIKTCLASTSYEAAEACAWCAAWSRTV